MTTVSGSTGIQATLDSGSNDQNGIATALASQISAALSDGSLTRTDNTNPSVGTGFFVSAAGNTTIVMQRQRALWHLRVAGLYRSSAQVGKISRS